MTEIEWLAGRGYNVLGVTFPAVFEGERDRAVGNLIILLPMLQNEKAHPIPYTA